MIDSELIKQADQLSRQPGKTAEAWAMVEETAKNPASAGYELSEKERQQIAWILYRYLSREHQNLDSTTARRMLALYFPLSDGKPSLLHSMMLKLAISCAKRFPELDFHRYLMKWNPALFREDDYVSDEKNGVTYPCLATLALVRASAYPESGGLKSLLRLADASRLNKTELLKVMRRRYCSQMADAVKGGETQTLRDLLDEYSHTLCWGEKSGHHSKALGFASRHLNGDDLRQFTEFFESWLTVGFRDDDWQSVAGKDGRLYPGVAEEALKKIFDIIKSDPWRFREMTERYLPHFAEGAKRETAGHWQRYRYAKLLMMRKQYPQALDILRGVRGTMSMNWYYWADLAECTEKAAEKTALLCRAMTLSHDPRFTAPIHLSLAGLLADEGKMAEAAHELAQADAIRKGVGARCGKRQEALAKQLAGVQPTTDNRRLYHQNAARADDFLFCDLPWMQGVIERLWTSKEGKPVARLRLEKGIEAICSQSKLRNIAPISEGMRILVKADMSGKPRILKVTAQPASPSGTHPLSHQSV